MSIFTFRNTIVRHAAGVFVLSAAWLAPQAAGQATPVAPVRIAEEPQPPQPTGAQSGPAEEGRADSTWLDQHLDGRLRAKVFVDEAGARDRAVAWITAREHHHAAMARLEQCQSCHGNGNTVNFINVAPAVAEAPDGAPAEFQALWAFVARPDTPWIGISVGPADDVLRSQLKLPEGAGVVITSVTIGGPALPAGVDRWDILLSVNGEPVSSGKDLDRILGALKPDDEGNYQPVTLSLVHLGQRRDIEVTPVKQTTQEAVKLARRANPDLPELPAYRIGVSLTEPDPALRSHLKLGRGGVVVTGVEPGSAAEKQGVKVNDVLVSANGKPLTAAEQLGKVVQAAEDKSPVELELLRGGVPLKISVTPHKLDEATLRRLSLDLYGVVPEPRELVLVQPGVVTGRPAEPLAVDLRTGRVEVHPVPITPAAPAASTAERLDQIATQLEQLRATVEALRAEVKGGKE